MPASQDDDTTAAMPQVGPPTRPLPPVGEEAAPDAPTQRHEPVAQQPVAQQPVAQQWVPQPPPAPRPAAPTPGRRRGRGGLLAAVAVLALLAGVGTAVLVQNRSGGSGGGSSSSSAGTTKLQATVTSVDPSGGTGLRRSGSTWRTQTYRSADFGGLKPGVGLVLDLGSAHAVTSVVLDVSPGGATVGLRAADDAPTSGKDLPPVGSDVPADGRTTLDGTSGGKHRYWLVWVTKLGPKGSGFGATLSAPVVTGS